MKYELIPNASRGVLIDRTPILQDIRDTYEVSFLMPKSAAYVVLFKGEDGIEYRKTINDGVCKIPKELLAKEQYVEVIVCQIDDEKVIHTWECEPLKITALLNLRQTQWQVSGGMTDKDCYARLCEMERVFSQSIEEVSKIQDVVRALVEDSAVLKKQNIELAENYNAAIVVVNDLSLRLKALEKNYDPTVID